MLHSILPLHVPLHTQLSKLTLQTQTVPFQCEDVAVGSTSDQELLAQCQEELNGVRAELDQKLQEMELLHGELAALKGEQEGTRTELEDHRHMLQVTRQEKTQVNQEVRALGVRGLHIIDEIAQAEMFSYDLLLLCTEYVYTCGMYHASILCADLGLI